MDGNYITWNAVNWITVVFMVAIGAVLAAGIASIVRQNLPTAA